MTSISTARRLLLPRNYLVASRSNDVLVAAYSSCCSWSRPPRPRIPPRCVELIGTSCTSQYDGIIKRNASTNASTTYSPGSNTTDEEPPYVLLTQQTRRVPNGATMASSDKDTTSSTMSTIHTTNHSTTVARDSTTQQQDLVVTSSSPDQESTSTLETGIDCTSSTISILTLNRTKSANAMNRTMLQQLRQALDILEDQMVMDVSAATTTARRNNPPPRCLVLCSALAHKGVFSAGADLKERSTMSMTEAAEFVSLLRMTFHRVASLPIPVICALEGLALGGGLELALCADLRIAHSTKTILGLPETSLAIVPGAGGTQRLMRTIGLPRAKQMIFLGQRINGQTAYEYGLVQHVVNPSLEHGSELPLEAVQSPPTSSSVWDVTMDWAWKIAQQGPIAIRAAKWAMQCGILANSMEEALDIERQAYDQVIPTQDRLEALEAFRNGRKPNYSGR